MRNCHTEPRARPRLRRTPYLERQLRGCTSRGTVIRTTIPLHLFSDARRLRTYMGYSKHSKTSSTPVQDLISSAVFGVVLGFTLFVISEQTDLLGYVLRRFDLPALGGRIGVTQFVIFGAGLGVVLDLFGKLFSRRR